MTTPNEYGVHVNCERITIYHESPSNMAEVRIAQTERGFFGACSVYVGSGGRSGLPSEHSNTPYHATRSAAVQRELLRIEEVARRKRDDPRASIRDRSTATQILTAVGKYRASLLQTTLF